MRTICALFLLAGCASDAPPPCELSGSYRVSSREVSGDCGPLGQEMGTADDDDGCWTRYSAPPSDVECGKNYVRRCTAPDGSYALLGVSVARDEDDETWRGAVDATLYDPQGQALCHSLYRVQLTSQ